MVKVKPNLGVYISVGITDEIKQCIKVLENLFTIKYIRHFESYFLDNLVGIFLPEGFSQVMYFTKHGKKNILAFLEDKNKFLIGYGGSIYLCTESYKYSDYDNNMNFVSKEPYATSLQFKKNFLGIIKFAHGPLFSHDSTKGFIIPYHSMKYFKGEHTNIMNINNSIMIKSDPDTSKSTVIFLDNNEKAEYFGLPFYYEFYEPKDWIIEAKFDFMIAIFYSKQHLFFGVQLADVNPNYFLKVIKKFLKYHYSINDKTRSVS